MAEIDSVDVEVLRNQLISIVYEMGVVLRRTAYSPNIREREDCSCVLSDAVGQIIAQAEHIPGHLGMLTVGMPYLLRFFPLETWNPGDVVIFNTPEGGSHLPDIRIAVPLFYQGHLVGFSANLAHHADVGGMVPGSMPPTSTEVFQEGIIIPCIKLYDKGVLNKGIMDLFLRNVRTPDEREGDLRAQIASAQLGQKRVVEVIDRIGLDNWFLRKDEILNYSERLMRAKIKEKLPQGTFSAELYIDDDGFQDELIKIAVTVSIKEDHVKVDFSGTDPERKSGVNTIPSSAISAAYFVVKGIVAPSIPVNSGCYRPIEIYSPPNTIINPSPSAAVGAGNETWQRIAETIIAAFSKANPEISKAPSHGCMNNVVFGGVDPRSGKIYTYYETIGGGEGARCNKDGMDGVHVLGTNTMNTPVEVFEMYYPLSIEEYELIPDSGGPGKFRGGLGIKRKYKVRGHTSTLTVNTDWIKQKPDGLLGGGRGRNTRIVFNEGIENEITPSSCKVIRNMQDGETFTIYTGGGNGYGPPAHRSMDSLDEDIRNEKVSLKDKTILGGKRAKGG
ncbi:MAG TPA: hydantoinase B/oxoprolinase family protein [Syntrophales bacterium]|nr:hydantoinase B/oxoprolinase family protein [Syntrophales bacterium]